jgi:hypothetical protein
MNKKLKLYEYLKRESVSLFEGAHSVHTPRSLTEKVLKNVTIEDTTSILVMFNVEFVITLIEVIGVKPEQITFYTDHENKTKLMKLFGVKYIEEINDMKFDVVIGNPPYTSGSKLLYTKFFAKAIELGDLVEFVMPVQLDSLHDKLKHHNHLLKKHLIKLGDNVSNEFNVGYNTIHHVTASKNVINTVQEPVDPIDSLDLLYPGRKRLNFTKGDTDTGQTTDPNGVTAIDKIHKNDTVIWRKIPQAVYNKSNKKSNAPYLVCVNHTPSRGKFNCAIVTNTTPSYTWAIWTFVLEAKTLEEATKLQAWLKSDEITNEVSRMFAQRGDDFYTVSKKILDRLPYYE